MILSNRYSTCMVKFLGAENMANRAKHVGRITNQFKKFKIGKTFSNWYNNQPQAGRLSFFSALLIGFVSHLFIYTGRYFTQTISIQIKQKRLKLFATAAHQS